jgi:hypothetical protein
MSIHDKRLLMSTESLRCNIKVCILVVERELKLGDARMWTCIHHVSRSS